MPRSNLSAVKTKQKIHHPRRPNFYTLLCNRAHCCMELPPGAHWRKKHYVLPCNNGVAPPVDTLTVHLGPKTRFSNLGPNTFTNILGMLRLLFTLLLTQRANRSITLQQLTCFQACRCGGEHLFKSKSQRQMGVEANCSFTNSRWAESSWCHPLICEYLYTEAGSLDSRSVWVEPEVGNDWSFRAGWALTPAHLR